MALDFNSGGPGDEDAINMGTFAMSALQAASFSAWFFITGLSENPAVVLGKDRGGGGGAPVFAIGREEDPISFLQEPICEASATGTGDVAGTTTIASNTWHFIVATYDGSDLKLYFDGLFEGSVSLTGDLDDGVFDWAIAMIIQGIDPNRREFEGRIEDCRYYGVALSAAEILTMFTVAGIDGIAANDRWMLDEAAPNVAISGAGIIKDLGSGQNNGTTEGTNITGADGILRSRRRYI